MSSKAKASSAATSGAIVRTGPKEVSLHPSRHGKRQQTEKPTTTRALVLRNGKHGAMGSGEIIASNKITGREKLDLLAEELLEKMNTAVMSPFKMEDALKIADAQFGLYRDDIVGLKDPELFRHLIEKDLEARTPPGTEPRRNASNLAKIIGTRIHNSYMLASAWKLVNDTLAFLSKQKGVTDKNIKMKLKEDEVREKYLVLYDMVNHLVDMSHSRLSVLATTAPYYHQFFRAKPANKGEDPEILFEWNKDQNLRVLTKSFLDSIIIELCFPRAPIPKYVLYALLRECMDEAPHDGKRLTQAMSDAIGNLSDAVQLQALLSAPLHGAEGEGWLKEPRKMPEEFEKWVDAQYFSSDATSIEKAGSWKDMTYPLATTKKKETLQNIWKSINLEVIRVSGIDIDRLWQLDGCLEVTPQWSSYWFEKIDEEDEGGEDGDMPRLGKKKKKPLAILGPDDAEDSTGSMPALQSVSNSSEDEDYSDPSDEDDEIAYESESSYDTDEEDEIRELVREAMEAGHEVDWFDTQIPAPEMDPLRTNERRGNPFLKALGSLRGRLFNSNPKIKVTTNRDAARPNARGAFRATPSGAPKAVPTTSPPKPGEKSADGSHKTTMEEVEDEEAGGVSSPKKKKKKRGGKNKKKKPAPGAPEEADDDEEDEPVPASPPASPKAAQAVKSRLGQSSFGTSASTLNIPVVDPSAAHSQSGRSYVKELNQPKEKVKSRGDHASIFSTNSADTKKSGGLKSAVSSLFGKGKDDQNKNPKYTWFSRLSKKATESMHQLLRTSEEAGKAASSMKWETFLKLMREMGFEYDPSTAGSSVRFDPPHAKDKPITIHKPHPDPTLTPIMLRNIGKRLKRYYGWEEDDFIRQTQERAGK